MGDLGYCRILMRYVSYVSYVSTIALNKYIHISCVISLSMSVMKDGLRSLGPKDLRSSVDLKLLPYQHLHYNGRYRELCEN